jgi:hypothetical protein
VSLEYPLVDLLKEGTTATEVQKLLGQHDCLTFPQLHSGLFPAANFDNLEADQTGMANAWLRDSCCIGLILIKSGKSEMAAKTARGVVDRLRMVQPTFKKIVAAGRAPEDDKQRPPVRYAGQDSEPRYDWANAQNDALGYSLKFIGAAAEASILDLSPEDKSIIELVLAYLEAVEYWNDAESGHWEEIKKVNASSIGTVVGGIEAIRSLIASTEQADTLAERGQAELAKILPYESKTPGLERPHDSALIFLVEPQVVLKGEMATKIITDAEQHLMGEHGFRRYNGDSYWGPDYREHFLVGARAGNFSDPKDMVLRDQYLQPGAEAQWTFFDPLLAAYYAHRFAKSSEEQDQKKARSFMARSLKNIIMHEQKGSGKKVWRLPELFFMERGEWVPNDHLGLLWGQANLLYGLNVYEEVFGEEPIKQ